MSMKFSMVFTVHLAQGSEDHLEKLCLDAIKSFRPHCDEIVVTQGGGRYSPLLMEAADIYVYNHENIGFSKNCNQGWKVATGDYVAICNSDIYLVEGNPRDLCIPGKVTSPHIVNQGVPALAGCMWISPKTVTQERGMLLELLKTYSSDEDYNNRVKDIFQKVESVSIYHIQQQTVKALGIEGGPEQARDKALYEKLKKKGIAS